jgi:hypothetical protein
MDLNTAMTLFVTVALALTGYFYTLFLARRRDRLDRINRQLSDLYGPLYALSKTGNHVWASFRTRHRPHWGSFWKAGSPMEDSDAKEFRLWIRSVFMPLNRRMMDLVVNKADLLEGTKIPKCLLDLCAHTSSYEALLERWDHDDFTENEPIENFPGHALLEYIEQEFCRLKQEQDSILRSQGIFIIKRKKNFSKSSGFASVMSGATTVP